MSRRLSKADFEFRNRLESLQWEPAQFNHREHLRLAYVYLCDLPVNQAFESMRKWTFDYLAYHDLDASKYHETLTRSWILAVRHFMEMSPNAESSEAFVESQPQMLDSKIMLTHYSESLLFSERAKAQFVEPDLDPIPRYPDFVS